MNPSCTVILEKTPAPDDVRFIQDGLRGYNLLYAPADNFRPLAIFLRDADQRLVGGLLGGTYWGWLHVDILWLEEGVRRQGYGQRMLELAEAEAVRRGCRYSHLDTLSFQALGFYEEQGYTVWGVLEDLPPGYQRYFVKKVLQPVGE